MTSLGFENYAEALKVYLSKYRDVSVASNYKFTVVPDTNPLRLQQQNQTNRDRVMEGNPWGAGGAPGDAEKGESGAAAPAEYAEGAAGAAGAEGSSDANYMYNSHGSHNGGASAENY